MEEKYANKEILMVGITFAILAFSAHEIIDALILAVTAVVLIIMGKWGATKAAVYVAAGGVAVYGGKGLMNNAEKLAIYTGVASGVWVITGLILIVIMIVIMLIVCNCQKHAGSSKHTDSLCLGEDKQC